MAKRDVWAVQYDNGAWLSPDHFVSARTTDPRLAKPFFGEQGKRDAQWLARRVGSVVKHPHPEQWT